MSELSIIVHSSAQQPHSGYSSRVSEQTWKQVRPMVEQMFWVGKTKKEILDGLEENHSFRPSMGQLVARMMKWRLAKNQSRRVNLMQPRHDLTRNSALKPAMSFRGGSVFDLDTWFGNSLLVCVGYQNETSIRSLILNIDDGMFPALILVADYLDPTENYKYITDKFDLALMNFVIAKVARETTVLISHTGSSMQRLCRTAIIILYLAGISCSLEEYRGNVQAHLLGYTSFCENYGLNSKNQPELFRVAAQLDLYVSQQSKKPPALGMSFEQSQRRSIYTDSDASALYDALDYGEDWHDRIETIRSLLEISEGDGSLQSFIAS